MQCSAPTACHAIALLGLAPLALMPLADADASIQPGDYVVYKPRISVDSFGELGDTLAEELRSKGQIGGILISDTDWIRIEVVEVNGDDVITQFTARLHSGQEITREPELHARDEGAWLVQAGMEIGDMTATDDGVSIVTDVETREYPGGHREAIKMEYIYDLEGAEVDHTAYFDRLTGMALDSEFVFAMEETDLGGLLMALETDVSQVSLSPNLDTEPIERDSLEPAAAPSTASDRAHAEVAGGVGLSPGNSVQYRIHTESDSRGNDAMLFTEVFFSELEIEEGIRARDTEWFRMFVTEVDGDDVATQSTVKFISGDLKTLDTTWHSRDDGLWFVHTDLEVGDAIETGTRSMVVRDIVSREYGGEARDVYEIAVGTRSDEGGPSSVEYFDRATGMALDQKTTDTAPFPGGGHIEYTIWRTAERIMLPSADTETAATSASEIQEAESVHMLEDSGDAQGVESQPASRDDSGGCLIATAAHGTELAPQVQALREARDGALLTTGSGAAFMRAFSYAYYSFSPAVADLERQSPELRAAVAALAAPMLYSMSLMSLAEEGSEASVVSLGAAVVMMNLGMYVAAPAAGVAACARIRGAAR